MPDADLSKNQGPRGVGAILVRLYWMFFGNIVFAVSIIKVLQGGASFSAIDIVYWLLIPTLIGARYLDIARFKGCTSYGEPATMAHWKRYTIGVAGGGLGAWLAAHAIAFALA